MTSEPKASFDWPGFGTMISDIFGRIGRWLEENGEQLTALARQAHRNLLFEKAGWLMHYSSPLHLISDEMTAQDIGTLLENHYRTNWPVVAADFRVQLARLDIDDEARATFEEALIAHEAGLYRASVRVLFPEIERVAREHLLEGTLKGIASLGEVRQAAQALGWSDVEKFGDGPFFGQFTIMSQHLYALAKTPERIAELASSPIPNRHAAIHGLVAYNSLQNSLSALIMAEFMFKLVAILKTQNARASLGSPEMTVST